LTAKISPCLSRVAEKRVLRVPGKAFDGFAGGGGVDKKQSARALGLR
jgi:hypothetical protein